ncbi:MAG: alpha/beta hydrolase [Anaerolineales bacterium]|nr:alpha/beta hydrolase [Anaerolineales bacterium]
MPLPIRDETKELNDETRKDASGSFIQLSKGVTHYETANADEQETVVLVHGFSVPYFVFDSLFQFLSDSGFRVLRYDLYGRGFSDRPDTRYNIDLFVEQLTDLLDALRFTSPINLVGLSMGGPITATFTTRYPERVKSLTLIDPTGARAVAPSLMLRMVKLPFVAEAVLSVAGSGAFVKSAAKDFFDPNLVERFTEQYKSQIQFKGFQRAILSTVRNNMLGSFIETYKLIGTMDKPVALFWGRNDATVPFEYSDDLRAAIPNAEFYAIEGAGHIPHYEKPETFNPILLKFLRK